MNQRSNKMRSIRQSMRGMSLPEILAAVLIGLIGMIVIMQVYATSEERKRTTTGTSDAQINGSIALYTLENAMRSAGFGMVTTNNNMLGCNTRAYNVNLATPNFNFLMAPVVINVGAAGAPDSITVVTGSSPVLVEGQAFAGAATSGLDFPLKNAAGIQVGDLVVASDTGVDCSLAEVTGFVVASTNTVQHVNAANYSYINAAGNTINVTASYNKPNGLGVDYSTSALLFSLGQSPSVVTFQIDPVKGRLRSNTLIPAAAAPVSDIGDGIVQLKAQYGKDTSAPSDGVVDVWDTVLPVGDVQWKQVIAIRIALLSRSAQMEKTEVTTAAPTWHDSNGVAVAFTMTNLDGTADSGAGSPSPNNWRKYRYRVYENVVPLRNIIWSQ